MAPQRSILKAVSLGCLFVLASCGGSEGPTEVPVDRVSADRILQKGDVDKALDLWAQRYAADPTSTVSATGLAYGAILEGDYVKADKLLEKVEGLAGENKNLLGDTRLRRVLVAIEQLKDPDNAGDAPLLLERIAELGQKSGWPQGQVLAAEALLCLEEIEDAEALLTGLVDQSGAVGRAAKTYMQRISADGESWQRLAEAEACWAVGQYQWPMETVADTFKGLKKMVHKGNDWEMRGDEEAVVWASRAIRQGQVDVAQQLLKYNSNFDASQRWRVAATKAHIACAEGNVKRCVSKLTALKSDVPLGVSDARVMGAFLLGPQHAEAALELLGEDQTVPAAFVAGLLAGPEAAERHAPESDFKDSLGR